MQVTELVRKREFRSAELLLPHKLALELGQRCAYPSLSSGGGSHKMSDGHCPSRGKK